MASPPETGGRGAYRLPASTTGANPSVSSVAMCVAAGSAGLLGVVFGLIEGQRYDWGAVSRFVTISTWSPGVRRILSDCSHRALFGFSLVDTITDRGPVQESGGETGGAEPGCRLWRFLVLIAVGRSA